MQRFIYSPGVDIFIRLEETGQVINVSEDVISGSVTRRTGALSDATVELQNKNQRYTRLIKPMDRISISMTRVKPTLVFTGFVDEAGLFQSFPGKVTVKASCPLKLLQRTYFDPGVQFTQDFFARHGWAFTPDGTLSDQTGAGAFGNFDINGGIGDVLMAVMTEIGGWPKDFVHMTHLPHGLIHAANKLLLKSQVEDLQDYFTAESRLHRLLAGTGTFGQPQQAPAPTPNGLSKYPIHGQLSVQQVAQAAYDAGFRGEDLVIAVAVAGAESSYIVDNPGNPGYYGLWQISHAAWPNFKDLKALETAEGNAAAALYVWNHPIRGKGRWDPWETYTNQRYVAFMDNARKAAQKIDTTVGSVPLPPSSTGGAGLHGQPGANNQTGLAYPLAVKGTNGQGPGGRWGPSKGTHSLDGIWQSDNAVDVVIPYGTAVLAVEDGTISPNGWGYGPSGSNDPRLAGLKVHLVNTTQTQVYFYTHLSKLLVARGDTVTKGQIIGYSGRAAGIDHLHFAVEFGSPYTALGADVPAGGVVGTGAASSVPSVQDEVTIANQAAYFQIQLQGSDFLASQTLTKKRALANDITLFEWIQTLVSASGREFMSLPSGDFLAFYPDYFGFYGRSPYWKIREIEIMDFTVQINDREFATHVFCAGPIQSITEIGLADRALSAVASVEDKNAFDIFIYDKPPLDGIKFLKQNGARPFKHDLTNVRHPTLLWLGAWQKFAELWSSRWMAEVSITFMPELMPGGLVEIDDMITMYVQEVTHSFDREAGFTTSATMKAPALATTDAGKVFGDLPYSAESFNILRRFAEDEARGNPTAPQHTGTNGSAPSPPGQKTIHINTDNP